jgi:tetratricopeptide (TPR) repeat protein
MNRKQRRAATKLGSPATQLLATGLQLHQAGRLVAAEACYRKVLAAQPNHAAAHSNLGLALTGQGKLDDVVAAYRQAIRIAPDMAIGYSNLGNALRSQGKLDEAVAACRQAIGIKPDFAEAHSNLGGALAAQGKLDEAVAAYRQAIAIKPDFRCGPFQPRARADWARQARRGGCRMSAGDRHHARLRCGSFQPRARGHGALGRSAIDECGYSAENQVAAKIVVIENRPAYLCLDGVVKRSDGSEIFRGCIKGPRHHVGGSQ